MKQKLPIWLLILLCLILFCLSVIFYNKKEKIIYNLKPAGIDNIAIPADSIFDRK